MKLIEVKVTNFRGYRATTAIQIDSLTVLVGRNDAGKSTVLDALDVFFNDALIDRDDCCVHTGSLEVRIACVFDDLPSKVIVDEQFETNLRDEYLVRADGKLEVIRVFDCSGAKGKAVAAMVIANHPSAAGVDDLLSLKLSELKALAKTRAVDLTDVNQTVKAEIRRSIWKNTPDLQLVDREISLKKETAKDAFDQIQKAFPTYALFKSDRASTDQDSEAQDPMKAAIKDAMRGREAELNSLIAAIKLQLEDVANRTVEKIREMSPDLASQLNPTVKNKPWDSIFSVTLTGEQDIPINKRGSGTRRLVLLNFFRAQIEHNSGDRDLGVIYAVEEPETSQHPNHQLMLLDTFEQLVARGNCQVLLTTHTPTLARRVNRACLRLIAKSNTGPTVEHGSLDGSAEKIVATLGVLPDHDVKVFFGVEGKHDINFLRTLSSILAVAENDIPDLELAEKRGSLVFIPLGGSNLELWVQRLRGFNRPEFYLTDRDNSPPLQPKYHHQIAQWQATGCTAWATTKKELENYLDVSLLIAAAPGYSGAGNHFDDVPALFAEAIHNASPGVCPWTALEDEKKSKKISAAKKRLNTALVSQMTPALLSKADPAGEVRGWLREVGAALRA